MSKFMKLGCLTIALWVSACLTPSADAAVLAYEGFNYPNSGEATVIGLNGGTGWGGEWTATVQGTGFTVSQDDTSLTSAAFPLTPAGDRLLSAGAGSGSNNMRVGRILPSTFDFGAEGILYASFLFQKDGDPTPGTGGNNMEFNLLEGDSGNGVLRFGAASSNRFFIYDSGGVPAEASFRDIVLGTTYFVVLRIESHAAEIPDVMSAVVYDPSETVPTLEPATWHGVREASRNEVVDRLRLWIGTVASGQWDEIRLGQTWADVTSAAAPLQPGDFDGDGDVDGADFVVWQTNFPKAEGGTLDTGDADGDGDVDGADFVVWQTNFPFTPGPAVTPIPEPGNIILALLGLVVAFALTPRGCNPWACSR